MAEDDNTTTHDEHDVGEDARTTPKSGETEEDPTAGDDPAVGKVDGEDVRAEMKELEEADELPSDPQQWPEGKAKFQTFASEDDRPFGEGPTSKLGPGSLNFEDDGSVTIDGEPVDDPDSYRGEPIPGGPTDPNTPTLKGEERRDKKMERQQHILDERMEELAKAAQDGGERTEDADEE